MTVMEAVVLASSAVHVAASDCETLRDFFGQPANVLSSLAMSFMGLWLVLAARHWTDTDRRRALGLVGAALIATGLGSVAFHGPGGFAALVFHDVSITALPLAAAAAMESERRSTNMLWLFGVPMTLTIIARVIADGAHYPVTAAAFVWFGYAVMKRRAVGNVDTRWLLAAGVCLVTARIFFQFSRTDGFLCRPDSLLQGHAAWHLLIGLGVVLAARGLLLLPQHGLRQ
jgi:hypothetical protein